MVPGVRSLKFAASRKCLRARRLDGKLIAGGSFNTAGGAPASRIANWDGSSWQPFGSGLLNVRSLAVYDGELIAGGGFSTGVARWDGVTWQTRSHTA